MKKWFACLAILVAGCSINVPEQVKPVAGFEISPYLGTWYEIARLDHSFEEGLDHVTAEYSLKPDGGIKVINRGFNAEEGEWDEAEGKAYFVESSDVAHLKVSFFGPFYASYIVFYLDDNYETALISGPDHSYFWILSRHKSLSQDELDTLVLKAKAAGFDTEKLIYVDQS
ncbi:MAG TPA: lipocalin [Gammaproteobacteria bacterium]|nr:lipocalin family protein [Pseudomonadota bacterium]HBF08203.1 lipocalin [Gammaproteobacteria bacterium]HCK91493.1 lipocalin [Gammaproteobacteria bacterium]|tara:strand:- start:86763 stop:87275 length:513 start_codon:yes stop_codon:yes gene_type:complete